MPQSVGAVALDLKLNSKGIDSQIQNVGQHINTNMTSQLSSLGGMAKKIGATIASAFAIKTTINFGKECMELGSDLAEVQNVVDVAFPKMSGTIDKFAKNAAAQFGLSETMAKRYAGTFGSMSKAFGFTEKEAANMSTTLTGLSGDVASFYNISQDEAYTKLKSVFTGETESLKDLGVVMTQTALDQFALQNGFGKTTAKMTEQEKVALRYAFVQKQLTDASGDFARTSDSWANQTRLLSLQFDSLKASIGQGLINVFTPVIKLINTLLGKLSVLANAFKSFTEMLMGKKDDSSSVKNTSDDLKNASDNANDASSGVNKLTNATKKAAKAARGLANFDKLNVLQQSTASDNGTDTPSTGGASAGNIDVSKGIDAGNGSLGKMDKWLSQIMKKVKELAKNFTKGFKIGFKSDGLDKIQGYVKNIGQNIKEIFTDPKVVNAASEWADNVAFNMGRITGSVASIGTSIGTMLIGGFNKFIEENKDYFKNKIVELLDISSQTSTIQANFMEAVADIFTVFEGDNAQQIVSDLLTIFTKAGLETYELCQKIGRDVLDAITQPIIENKDKVKEAIENTLEPISTVTGQIKDSVSNIFETIQEKYDEYVQPAFDKLGEGLSTICSYILDAYNTYVAPVLDSVAEDISELMDEYIEPCVTKVVEVIGKIVNVVSELFNFLSPILGAIYNLFIAKIIPVIQIVWTVVKTCVAQVINIINTVLGVFSGLIDFITGIFSGDWDKAWNGIKEVFSSIFEGMKNAVKNVFSAIKKIISTIISAIVGIFKAAWKLIKNVFSGVKEFFSGVFGGAWKGIKSIWNKAGDFFSGIWKGIKKAFAHVTDWLKNTFSKAWEAVKNVFNKGGKVFAGIKDGIVSVFKTVVNALIGGINFIIRKPFNAINSMLNKIRDVKIIKWHPFKKLWGENPLAVPQIPKLAEGAVLKPNAPFLAMVGDQKHGTNIESPLSTIVDAFKKVQGDDASNSVSNAELLNAISNMQINIVVQQDSRGTFNLVKKEAIEEKKRTGKPAFI